MTQWIRSPCVCVRRICENASYEEHQHLETKVAPKKRNHKSVGCLNSTRRDTSVHVFGMCIGLLGHTWLDGVRFIIISETRLNRRPNSNPTGSCKVYHREYGCDGKRVLCNHISEIYRSVRVVFMSSTYTGACTLFRVSTFIVMFDVPNDLFNNVYPKSLLV